MQQTATARRAARADTRPRARFWVLGIGGDCAPYRSLSAALDELERVAWMGARVTLRSAILPTAPNGAGMLS